MPIVSLPPMRLSRSSRLLKRTFDIVASPRRRWSCSRRCCLAIAVADQARQPRPGVLPPGAPRPRRRDVPDRQVPHDGRRRREPALRAAAPQRDGRRPLFKIKRRPADHPRRRASCGAWSIDELPQLWNVLRGEMSLVGPRPFVVHESEQITGWAGRRLETTPGITGLWQVLGRNDIPFDEMVKLDYVYVTNWSLWWDIKILVPDDPRRPEARGRTDGQPLRDPGVQRGGQRPAPARRPRGAAGAVAAREPGDPRRRRLDRRHRRRRRAYDGAAAARGARSWAQPGARRARSTAASGARCGRADDALDRHAGVRHDQRPRRARGDARRRPRRRRRRARLGPRRRRAGQRRAHRRLLAAAPSS